MLSMQDYINNIKFWKKIIRLIKKIFKISVLITGIVLVILAFLKRKQIAIFFSSLFNNKT